MGGGGNGHNNYTLEDTKYYSFLSEPFEGNYTKTSDYKNVFEAIKFLNSDESNDPFVIFLPLMNPHPPYSCPEPWYSSIDPEDLPDLR
jgi:choline-sulfatase